MSSREPLTEKERRQVQWAYHKGTEARKQVIQRLFGRHITHASCMAMVDMYVRRAELKGEAKAIAKPTESELWDWLCCAAYHGLIWSQDADGKVRNWTEIHCQVMGESTWEEAEPELFEKHIVPDPIPSSRKIQVYILGSSAVRYTVRFAGPVLILLLGYFLERIADAIFP